MATQPPAKAKTARSSRVAERVPFKSISTPLGFFVLSLLIVETFLGTVTTVSPLSGNERFLLILLGVGMFVMVVLIVSAFVWFKPDNLTFDKDAHLDAHARDLDIHPRHDEQNTMTTDVSKHVRSEVENILPPQEKTK